MAMLNLTGREICALEHALERVRPHMSVEHNVLCQRILEKVKKLDAQTQ